MAQRETKLIGVPNGLNQSCENVWMKIEICDIKGKVKVSGNDILEVEKCKNSAALQLKTYLHHRS